MNGITFDFLTGVVTVDEPVPKEWREEGSLNAFYHHPNNDLWGNRLCRVLYHESAHFWQFLSSGYIANLLAEEWDRLCGYEATGQISPQSERVQAFEQRTEIAPFSPMELMECWVRYWDVHTRSPAQIIRDERLEVEVAEALERQRPDASTLEYTWVAFDAVMQQGVDRALYAAPYRWLLAQANNTLPPAVASYFVALTFPIITHAAFGSPDPVFLLSKAFQLALRSKSFLEGLITHVTNNINLDWLNNWSFVLGEIIQPIILGNRLPIFTSGLDVIHRGSLGSHPVFTDYSAKILPLQGHLKMIQRQSALSRSSAEDIALAEQPMRDFWVVFGLPGQPSYRQLLGNYLPPPAIRFTNFTLYAHRPVLKRLQDDDDKEETFQTRVDDLQERVHRFRAAEKAVSLGLPPNAFERAGEKTTDQQESIKINFKKSLEPLT